MGAFPEPTSAQISLAGIMGAFWYRTQFHSPNIVDHKQLQKTAGKAVNWERPAVLPFYYRDSSLGSEVTIDGEPSIHRRQMLRSNF